MVFVLYIIMLIGIARASDMIGHPESLADILTLTHAAGFLDDTHGEAFTDGIGMHTVLYLLQRSPYRDAPLPALLTGTSATGRPPEAVRA